MSNNKIISRNSGYPVRTYAAGLLAIVLILGCASFAIGATSHSRDGTEGHHHHKVLRQESHKRHIRHIKKRSFLFYVPYGPFVAIPCFDLLEQFVQIPGCI